MADVKIVDTICRMCGRYCPINAYVKDGKLIKITGSPGNFVTKGKVCGKGIAALQLEYDPKRLKHPLRRVGARGSGEWEQITWDEALNVITGKLKELKDNGEPQALVYHYGAAIQHVWGYLRRFMNLYGSPNVAGHSHLCHIPRALGNNATYGGMPQSDLSNTQLMILWGYNPIYSSLLHYGRQVMDAREGGAKLIVIDPVFTSLASKADIYVRPRPGSDGALALGLLNVIISEGLYDHEFVENWTIGFEELKELVKNYLPPKVSEITWVPEKQIIEVARLYATTSPAVLDEGNGLDQHTNVTQTSRTLSILRAITGNLGIKGGHVFRPGSGLKDIMLPEKLPSDTPSITKNPLYTDTAGTLSTPHVVDAILTGEPYPVKAMIVQGSGAGVIASNADKTLKAFRKLELLVVMDLFMTSTAEIADFVLPAASFLEQTSLISSPPAGPAPTVDTHFNGVMRRAVEPLGECITDHDFVFKLAHRMGYGEYFENPEAVFDEELKPLGLTFMELGKYSGGYIREIPPEQLYDTYKTEGFSTPSVKVELYSRQLEEYGYDPLPSFVEPAESPLSKPEVAEQYPLVCSVSYHLGIFTHSQYRTLPWLKELIPEAYVMIHPSKAKEIGVQDGEKVYVESLRGRIEVAAKITQEVDPRTATVAWGWGQPYASGDRPNLLTDDSQRCPISGATGNRSFLGRVVRRED